MPLSRDPRTDRRRRLMRDSFVAEAGAALPAPGRARPTRPNTDELDEEQTTRKRNPGYSQNVRRECQQRLVQLIPVRRRSYLLAIFVSCLIPFLLMAGHYAIFVNPSRWQNHPMAVLLYASHPRSICAWLSSQLWLFCLASTVLTFRLRRHKLDDYEGEYRLWFWLVATCILGSIDSTSRVSELFGNSLDRWSQLNLGWSGNAVVQATSATLIGMLGLRLCTELKAVPPSLVFWLVGLVSWAASAVLSHSMLKTDMNPAMREWLRSALWIGGLTSIWLSSLAYLRYVYIEAQRRFLLRGKLAASVSSTWRERLVESMPTMPRMPSFRLKPPGEDTEAGTKPVSYKKKQVAEVESQEEVKQSRFRWPSFGRKANASPQSTAIKQRATTTENTPAATTNVAAEVARPSTAPLQARKPITVPVPDVRTPVASSSNPTQRSVNETSPTSVDKKPKSTDNTKSSTDGEPKRTWMGRILGKSKRPDEAPEYSKVDKAAATAADSKRTVDSQRTTESQRAAAKNEKQDQPQDAKKRGWIPRPKMPKLSLPKIGMPKLPKIGMPKLPKMPKLKLPSLRLPPPEPMNPSNSSGASSGNASGAKGAEQPTFKPIPSTKPFPSTNGPAQEAIEANGGRPLSKAERKKLKRGNDEQEGQRRAA